jgi:hypothetical protein
MRVGFYINQIDNRGTGNALYDYARYNEEYLRNESVIYTRRTANHNALAVSRFGLRFNVLVDPDPQMSDVDVMYHIKYGVDDGTRFPRTRYAVHAVFNPDQPHGDRFAVVSEWMTWDHDLPYVPHMIDLPLYNRADLRQSLGIGPEAIVYGRYGGYDTFDISWAQEAVLEVADANPDKYFLFANTDDSWVGTPRKNIIFLPEMANSLEKVKFINTCNAMLHARWRGETFGIAVGEFSSMGKRILTYGDSPERAHIDNLADIGYGYEYWDKQGLLDYLRLLDADSLCSDPGYRKFTPDRVMDKFKSVFLD